MADFLLHQPVLRNDYHNIDQAWAISDMNYFPRTYPDQLISFVQQYRTLYDYPHAESLGNLYLIVGDEPVDLAMDKIEAYLDSDTLNSLTTSFQNIPRLLIMNWIDTNIKPQIDQTNWPVTRRQMFDLYNRVNRDHVASESGSPWVWEYIKILGWQQSYPDQVIAPVYQLTMDVIKQKAKDYVVSLYEDLPSIADFGLEFTRAFSIKKLLDSDEIQAAMSAVNAYHNISPDDAAILAEELHPANSVVSFTNNAPILPSDHPLVTVNQDIASNAP